ncbi:MAG: hypothetical protein J0I34_04680 [Pseudonocardia sp.]|uniref:hypothetical protein n=1 Tax=unclassified Pseudonocardia TaxID=2619320 RepID=UPI00086E5F14|nr:MULTISPECIES: hypothetical protein [unclassified Pseudonocardia]MBN9108058.1 hypothetical protein [Pseudonocardia sp.]ODU24227.1 MAG: hypothetical protein ABS80_13110 [Pseudonocardia sp. SCN 72-51]
MGLGTRHSDDHSDGREQRRPDHRRAASAVAVGALVATLAAGWVASTDPTAANRGWDAGNVWKTSQLG